jgi:glycosyltransferase involved in cell wall biosynthesis
LGESRNIGIRASKGNFVLFLDSDDYFKENDSLQTINMYLQQNSYSLDILSFSAS